MAVVKKLKKRTALIILMGVLGINSLPIMAKTATSFIDSAWQASYSYENSKKYADAANVLKPILEKSPKDEFALIRTGWLNYLQGKYDVSADYYHKALDINSESIDARLGITLPLMAQLRWKEAALYANQVIAMSAWDFTAHTRLMICESAQAQWDVLEKHATQFTKHYPSDPTGFVLLARAQAMTGKKADAIQNYKIALVRAPTNPEALKFLESKA